MMAFFVALSLVLILQPRFIRWFQKRRLGQPIREEGPKSHMSKQGTPTMGGVIVVGSIVVATLLFADPLNLYVWVTVFITIGYAVLGFMDDYKKVSKKHNQGITARSKLIWQISIAAIGVFILLAFAPGYSTAISLPFFKNTTLDLGPLFLPFAVLVIVGCSNAVNLTDGLDGLVTGPIMTVAFSYGVFAYVAGNVKIAEYLYVPYVAGAGELSIFAAAIVAGGLGFLWFNAFPAQVFMGDVGSLSLGGTIGMIAVITKQELALVIAGGVFVVEALSVVAQVTSFKLTGKRVLRMAPIHHHFELQGMAEPKIIVRCWILSIVLAIIALATLKLR